MKFLDEAKIYLRSGKGGDGCLSFRREKYVEFGGPDGGNGGKGGDVVFEATNQLNTLIDYRYQQHFKAKHGQPGMGKNRAGKSADDLIIKVPVGTEILEAYSEDPLIDLSKSGQRFIALAGGRGGRGNASFTSSTNRAPRQTTKGEAFEEMEVILRLKLLADVGLIGLPNAGKSTFLSAVSNAKPKIADYPFTTLKPQLGMVRHHSTDMVMADLPGLIAGAAQGVGLGHRFLQHTSRCQALLHLVDATVEVDEAVQNYQTIRGEVAAYDEEFATNIAELPEVLALSKADATEPEHIAELVAALEKVGVKNPLPISSVAQQGIVPVLDRLAALQPAPLPDSVDDSADEPV